MTREHKLALIVGFALVLAVAILISDHFSGASRAQGGGVVADNQTPELFGQSGREIAFDLPGAQDFTQPPAGETLNGRPVDSRVASNDSGPSVLESLADSVNTALHDLRNGNTPPVALQTETTKTIEMGKPVNPPTPDETVALRDYKRHNVQANETLWGIAAKYYGDGNLYQNLARHNAGRVGEGGTVHPGVTILIPPKHILLAGDLPTINTPTNTGAPVTTPTKNTARTYTVKKGDTLGLISQRELGTVKRMQEIIDLNRDQIDNADEIRVGMTLKLPARD